MRAHNQGNTLGETYYIGVLFKEGLPSSRKRNQAGGPQSAC
jgi:hypothetical protein